MSEWRYDHTFVSDFRESNRGVRPARVTVAIKPFEWLRESDVKLKPVDAWMRLVIWENLISHQRTYHANINPDLPGLLQANLQPFGPSGQVDFSAYMIDYDAHKVVFKDGDDPWPDPIAIPTGLLSQ